MGVKKYNNWDTSGILLHVNYMSIIWQSWIIDWDDFMLLIIIILIAFACGIVKKYNKNFERINGITVHFSGWPWGVDIQPCCPCTSEGWNPPQIPGGLTHQGILGRYPKGILERDLNRSSRIIVNSCFRMKVLTNHEECSRRTHIRQRLWNSRLMAHHFIGIMHSYRSPPKKKTSPLQALDT